MYMQIKAKIGGFILIGGRRRLLQTVEILKRQWIGKRVAAHEISIGRKFTVPFPIFNVSIGEGERIAMVVPPRRNV